MKLVLDANILFSALIKDSLTSGLLFREDLELYAPEFMIKEFMRYEKMILEKTHRSVGEYIELVHILKEVIVTVPKGEFSDFLEEARKISPDKDDFMYFALALKLGCDIWSNDKKLKEQNKVKIYSTIELLEFLRKTLDNDDEPELRSEFIKKMKKIMKQKHMPRKEFYKNID
ncbi:MAG: hypothetical protein KAT43_03600 [Nanoarchaeota archaeon]|nr:hypothetical protein [Nanoarchaeota archaeon]